ncbi:Glyceraldehyde-3-phosphate dehydrogenase [Planctomycetes bacterium Poly30]|uniref:Glyceraldehyde-3-phosphate dehydrogenase n=1 Tax=Saltatorellus ferox TaxID=2528018 RepID=A0A518ETQ3_9BACT|nr:Glyceraldehyde-3-phosphate dehydrogenase [Planctomycetes bacterium Poly30]
MRIAINGFGRIGRNVFRIIENTPGMEVVAINDLTDAATLAHLLEYDSVHGRFQGTVKSGKGFITVNGRKITITAERDPANLPHGENKVDFVVEATGVFTTREACTKHLTAGAKKVCLTVPPKDEIDAMIVMGVNHDVLKGDDLIISNASCTTNCLAPIAKVLDDAFGIDHGIMTTTHAYTNDQRILDLPHSDLRRARAAAVNIIPTSTGAARAVGKILPKLAGKLDGMALRVPVPDGSVVDLVARLKKPASIEQVNKALADAAKKGDLKGILEYSDKPLVSSDIIGNPHSSVVDSLATMAMDGGKTVKVISWYDNEWGYSNRVVQLMKFAHKMKPTKKAAAKKTAAKKAASTKAPAKAPAPKKSA